ncbi:uncharacterized protein PV09_08862 [Verruconis gallopava]|uniref:DUF7719 domain-containing protein n=1 Tax=Verruconis gallopava TaxID=253628 RepID=A0A0D1XB35_9PEZI|nr:uncharacterized protein PV09_08862 [Verruconis gallopava]KIV99430.1 hypothetical protein PV09_08862 [Verruconis gallopava]
MDDTTTPRNRRERRAAAKANGSNKSTGKATGTSTIASASTSANDYLNTPLPGIEYKKPDYNAARVKGHKTLYEIAAERQEELRKQGVYDKYEDKYAHGENAGDHQFWSSPGDEEPIGPLGEAFVWGVSLSMLHFTLDVLVFHQYRQEFEWREIWTRMFTMMPALFVVVYMLHTKTATRWAKLRQAFFFATSVAAGCFLIKSGNLDGYFAVMKMAPPLGTLWVWSTIEMELWWAVTHVVLVCLYMWWNGFTNF